MDEKRRAGSTSVARRIARYSDSCFASTGTVVGPGQLLDETPVLLRHVHHENGERAARPCRRRWRRWDPVLAISGA